ncbi:GH12020 [Drosophila grimshawi]|uniref:GH12020 n=1 Tax=Drosophila grimshawi TaxID=7222 RepID=B4JKP4_DROGR|nr:GH12020 [Drosophila grimshawi]
MDAQQITSVDVSGSASGRRRVSDPNLFGRPSEAGVPCGERAGPGARAATGRRPHGRTVRLVRVVRVERRRLLRRIGQEQRNRRFDEIELLASPLHAPSVEGGSWSERDEGEMASPPHAPSMDGDVVPEADEEVLPRRRRYPMNPDDKDTMPFPPATLEPDVIVISDEEEDKEWREDGGEAQGQGERPQIPPPTVTATYARTFADARWRHQVTLTPTPRSDHGAQHRPPWDHHHPRRRSGDPHSCARRRAPRRDPEAGPRPTLQRQSSAPEGEAGWQEVPPSAWPPGITEMAEAQPGPSRRASRIVWQDGHRYRVKTSMRGTRVFRKK